MNKMIITEDNAIKLLENEVYSHKDNFTLTVDKVMLHFIESGKIAKQIAKKVGFDPYEFAIAGIYHDIGRCFVKDRKAHTFHEILGARYIESKGVGLGISASQEQCDRIAQSVRSHFVVSEQFKMLEYSKWLPGLRDTNPLFLLPSSWNELIIIYADLTNVNGNTVTFEERLNDIKERDKKSDSPRLKAVKKAESRLLVLEKDLEYALQEGRIDTTKYSIL